MQSVGGASNNLDYPTKTRAANNGNSESYTKSRRGSRHGCRTATKAFCIRGVAFVRSPLLLFGERKRLLCRRSHLQDTPNLTKNFSVAQTIRRLRCVREKRGRKTRMHDWLQKLPHNAGRRDWGQSAKPHSYCNIAMPPNSITAACSARRSYRHTGTRNQPPKTALALAHLR